MGYVFLAILATCITAFVGWACCISDYATYGSEGGFLVLFLPGYIGTMAALIVCIHLHFVLIPTILWMMVGGYVPPIVISITHDIFY